MEQKTKKGLFTIIYPFMASILNLAGLAKECFAVIFGFWFAKGKNPVGVSLTTLQTITGGTRPAVIQAIYKLEKAGLIRASRMPGKKTTYDVILPEQTLAEFLDEYVDNKPVSTLNPKEYTQITRTSIGIIPVNNKKEKHKSVNTLLKVKNAGEIRTGGLKEA